MDTKVKLKNNKTKRLHSVDMKSLCRYFSTCSIDTRVKCQPINVNMFWFYLFVVYIFSGSAKQKQSPSMLMHNLDNFFLHEKL